ncbi:a44l protein-like protein [Leptomonas seymouri]|uniref:A44l protein-like protein n=1 Tax=Leptomonas seymouri TaxID=5684 RepID=A0A0N0P906_LEPSE|nr:a44l protein-like protein [Leptomonas seymouri]|eukprot:KPI90556.1 a44l protein-like protein [Leptomonas seymouri]
MQLPSPTEIVPVSGDRLQGLLVAFESRMQLLVQYIYQCVCDVSPLPFEWTVLVVVFAYITVRRLILWYTFDLKPRTHGYVYWHLTDLIEVTYMDAYKPEHHLSAALIIYITQKLWRDKPLTAAELKNKIFTIHLLSLNSTVVGAEYKDAESDLEAGLMFRNHERLMVPVKLPTFPCWTSVHENGVEMCTWISTTRVKNCYPEARRYLYLRVRKGSASQGSADADVVLRRFVDNAVGFYFANGYSDRNDRSLRMYSVSPSSGRILVKAYPMPLAPTLDTLFFPQREAVRMQLQCFMEMKGRYAIKGFPRKLGFLLYGPRGTGKRSFVRALAYHTKRHIVRIRLSSFTKNEQLYNTFLFEDAVYGSTEDWTMLNSKKVIFLLEDVDPESEVVHARSRSHTAHFRQPLGLKTRGTEALKNSFEPTQSFIVGVKKTTNNNSSNWDDDEDDVLTTPSSRTKSHTPRTEVSAKPTPSHTAAADVATPRPVVSSEPQIWGSVLLPRAEEKLDAINLSALLNILDGAIEDPHRIVVMIADHPEKLDPALLRPGRLATHIRFDYIEVDALIGLCGLFYGSDVLLVEGALENGAAAMPVRTRRGLCEYASADTDGDESLLFPHETQESSMKNRQATKSMMDDDDALLNWRRRELETAATDKLDKQVIRQLSSAQAAQVRACIAALEEESALRDNGKGDPYNFLITPAHAHQLCMRAKTLDAFLNSLRACIRGEAVEAENGSLEKGV